MAFDFAWDFRNTLPFVTDPLFATFAQNPGAEPFPHVYTNGNGLTVTAGYVLGTGDFGDADRSNTVDPRIAGVYFNNNSSGSSLFKIDLASGSAPGPGIYTIDLAFGDALNATSPSFTILDTAAIVIDGRNGGPGFSLAPGHFIDATLSDVAGAATWNGVTVTKSFSTPIVNISMNPDALPSGITLIAHFRLTLVPPTPPISPTGGGGSWNWWEELPRRIPRVPRLSKWVYLNRDLEYAAEKPVYDPREWSIREL